MTFEQLAALIRSRRTNMFVDKERPVPHAVVRELCELAQWAPNHKRTMPWRFALVEHDARSKMGDAAARAMIERGGDEAAATKTRTKFLRTPAILVVGSAPGDSPLRTKENRDATAAGVQNLLLGATAMGLASYWSSCPDGANDVVGQFCGFDRYTHVLAMIYLGWPIKEMPVPPRPPLQLTLIS
jgi:nitroreductase